MSTSSTQPGVITLPVTATVLRAFGDEEFKKPGGPDMRRIVSIAAEHGIHFAQA
jgi:hypothetical protein